MMLAFLFSSERRDSNPRPRPWQGRALPTELLSHDFQRATNVAEMTFSAKGLFSFAWSWLEVL